MRLGRKRKNEKWSESDLSCPRGDSNRKFLKKSLKHEAGKIQRKFSPPNFSPGMPYISIVRTIFAGFSPIEKKNWIFKGFSNQNKKVIQKSVFSGSKYFVFTKVIRKLIFSGPYPISPRGCRMSPWMGPNCSSLGRQSLD